MSFIILMISKTIRSLSILHFRPERPCVLWRVISITLIFVPDFVGCMDVCPDLPALFCKGTMIYRFIVNTKLEQSNDKESS
jgi:hypothetical protein